MPIAISPNNNAESITYKHSGTPEGRPESNFLNLPIPNHPENRKVGNRQGANGAGFILASWRFGGSDFNQRSLFYAGYSSRYERLSLRFCDTFRVWDWTAGSRTASIAAPYRW